MPDQDNVISTDQLQIGIYVYLDVGWMYHPFSFNNFKIKSESQLATIRSLGLKQVRWDPARSDLKPLAAGAKPARPSAQAVPARPAAPQTAAADPAAAREVAAAGAPIELPAKNDVAGAAADEPDTAVDAAPHIDVAAPAATAATASTASTAAEAVAASLPPAGAAAVTPAAPAETAAAAANADTGPEEAPVAAHRATIAAKQIQVERLQQRRRQISDVQAAFAGTVATIRSINKTIFSQPKETVRQSETLVQQMVEVFLSAPEVALQVMSEKPGGEDIYLHSLNVSVLALMMARELKLSASEVSLLGMGCLFHDIGMTEVPSKILLKADPLTKAERDFLQMHCAYGVDIAKRVKLSESVQKIIFQHHEMYDGSGYPRGLKGEAIDMLSRIVAIAEHYDELCNPPNVAAALTPHEALSQMFAQQRAKFDPRLLQVFIRCLGVFPPGTVVRLNNDVVGLVISINAARPLKPSLIVYDVDVPKYEAIIVDLDAEPDINISQAIRPALLPKAVFDYLSPKKRISYYFDPDAGKPPQAD